MSKKDKTDDVVVENAEVNEMKVQTIYIEKVVIEGQEQFCSVCGSPMFLGRCVNFTQHNRTT